MTEEKKDIKNIFTKKNVLYIIAGSLTLIILLILGYGFLSGKSIKNYAVNSQKMIDNTKDWDNLLDSEEDLSSMKNKIEIIKNNSDRYVVELGEGKKQKKIKQLNDNLIEYFTLVSNVSSETLDIIDWSIDIETATKNANVLSTLDSSSTETIVVSLELTKKNTENTISKLKKINPPASIKTFHNSFINTLSETTLIYQKLIDAIKTNNVDVLTSISSELSSIEIDFGDIPSPGETIESEFKSDIEKSNNLEKDIQTEIDLLKNTIFSF